MTQGKHRHPATLRLITLISLGVALAATAIILAVKPPGSAPAASSGNSPEIPLADAYPNVKAKTLNGQAGYTPLFFLDDKRSVGTATTADGNVVLLLDGRELRRLPKAVTPEFSGFVADGERLVWLELTIDTQGRAQSRLWTVDGGNAHLITEDTGDVALFDKRDDLVLHDGKVSWVAAAPTDQPQTEIRTVALTGGKVSVQRRDGAFSFAGWPWVTTVNLGQNGPIELHNLESGERIAVAVRPGELMACSPSWCRAVIVGSTPGSTVIELQKPNGSKRFRTVIGSVAASIVDVAVLDRFEIYSYTGGRLVLYDIEGKRAITVAKSGVTQVVSRGTALWWSTGDAEAMLWHVLDLKSLLS